MSYENLAVLDAVGRLRVIVVEDNEQFRNVLSLQLDALGCDVHLTSNSSEFLTAFAVAKIPFDFAVIDIRLPGLNGDQIISWLRESEDVRVENLAVLIITGYANDIPTEMLTNTSNIRLLEKPFSFAELKRAFDEIAPRKLIN